MRQLTREDIKRMSEKEVWKAALEGRCNALRGLPAPFDPDAAELKEQAGEDHREKPAQLGESTFLAMDPEGIPAGRELRGAWSTLKRASRNAD